MYQSVLKKIVLGQVVNDLVNGKLPFVSDSVVSLAGVCEQGRMMLSGALCSCKTHPSVKLLETHWLPQHSL